jgi:hypothetical protein
MKGNNNGWIVAGLGAAVAGLGATLLRGRLKDKAVGFGMAQLVLGMADVFRPSDRH